MMPIALLSRGAALCLASLPALASATPSPGTPLGPETLVYPDASAMFQWNPVVARSTSGNTAIAWGRMELSADYEINLRWFDAADRPLAPPIVVSASASGLYRTALAVARNGTTAVGWDAGTGSGSNNQGYVVAYGPSGLRLNESSVGDQPSGSNWGPSLAIKPDGYFFAAWTNSSLGIFGRKFKPNGTMQTPELPVSNVPPLDLVSGHVSFEDSGASAAILNDLQIVVAWTGNGGGQAELRMLHQTGVANHYVRDLTYSASSWDLDPQVVADPAGGFVVMWTAYDGAATYAVVQRFDAKGNPRRAPVAAVSAYYGCILPQRIAIDGRGNLGLVYLQVCSGRQGTDVALRVLDAQDRPLTGEIRVNEATFGDYEQPALAAGPAGDFVVVWYGPNTPDPHSLNWPRVAFMRHFAGAP